MGRRYPNPAVTGTRSNFSSLLDMGRVTSKYCGVGYGDGEGKTRPHPRPIAMPNSISHGGVCRTRILTYGST